MKGAISDHINPVADTNDHISGQLKRSENISKGKKVNVIIDIPTNIIVEDSILTQEDYLNKTYTQERLSELRELALSISPMHPDCILSINLPAYREGESIYHALMAYSVEQHCKKGSPLNPDSFEINILINRPNSETPFDQATENEIRRFQLNYPEYHIHVIKKTFDFPGKPLMGTIYKTSADIAIYRNLERKDSHNKQRLILRTGGADAREKNRNFLITVMNIFKENKDIQVYKSESRYPRLALEKIPLLHFLATLESGLNRLYTGGSSNVGLGSYSAHIYSAVGGFNPEKSIAEEIDLATRMRSYIATHPTAILHKNLIKNAIDDPRRALFALQNNILMVKRYTTFGNREIEHALRDFRWEALVKEKIPLNENLLLTKENLSREVSAYYRDYLVRTRNSSNTIKRLNASIPPPSQELVRHTTYEVVNKLFRRMFRGLSGMYSFIQHENIEEAQIIFHTIEKIEISMTERKFSGHRNFSKDFIEL